MLFRSLVSTTDWRDSLRSLTTDVGAERMWLEKIEVRCTAPRQATTVDGPLAEVAASLRSMNEEEKKELFAPLLQKLPDDVKEHVQSMLDPGQPRYAELLAEVETLLAGRLSGQAATHEN